MQQAEEIVFSLKSDRRGTVPANFHDPQELFATSEDVVLAEHLLRLTGQLGAVIRVLEGHHHRFGVAQQALIPVVVGLGAVWHDQFPDRPDVAPDGVGALVQPGRQVCEQVDVADDAVDECAVHCVSLRVDVAIPATVLAVPPPEGRWGLRIVRPRGPTKPSC